MFRVIHNAIDYPLRQFFKWSKKGLLINNEDKSELFTDISNSEICDVKIRAENLNSQYHLSKLYNKSKKDIYCINLYYLDLLETAYRTSNLCLPDKVTVADIGCAQWFYVQALYSFYKWWHYSSGRNVILDGFEIDAYRVYSDFYSRYDYAKAHIDGLPYVTYHPFSFQKKKNTYDCITMFFPFIFIEDHLKWGLPHSRYTPQKLLFETWYSLKENGHLIIVNQGEAENCAQKKMLEEAGITVVTCFRFSSPFFHYKHTHHVIVLLKGQS